MDKYDKQTIEELKRFKATILQKRIEEADLSYQEKIKRYIKAWKGESNVSEMGK